MVGRRGSHGLDAVEEVVTALADIVMEVVCDVAHMNRAIEEVVLASFDQILQRLVDKLGTIVCGQERERESSRVDWRYKDGCRLTRELHIDNLPP